MTAKDGAPDPRLATATVSISVIDVEDELPIFKQAVYEATIPENVPDHFVVDVVVIIKSFSLKENSKSDFVFNKADDPDSIKKITYVIQQGSTDLFRIDGNTGSIYTTRGLDYERENEHVLIIGTLENMSNEKGSTAKVMIHVEVLIKMRTG